LCLRQTCNKKVADSWISVEMLSNAPCYSEAQFECYRSTPVVAKVWPGSNALPSKNFKKLRLLQQNHFNLSERHEKNPLFPMEWWFLTITEI